MDQLPIFQEQTSVFKRLTQLLDNVSQQQRTGLSMNFKAKVKKVAEFFSPIQPQEVLHELLEKTSAAGPRKNWKYEETNYLIYIIDKYCLAHQIDPEHLDAYDWECISEYCPGRTSNSCQFRFLSLAPSSITDTPWLVSERQLLVRIIQSQQSANINWKLVSQKLYQLNPSKLYRTGKQCRQHYTCFLKPNLKKGPWTQNEDYQLVCLFLSYGKKWSKMAKYIEGRNQNSIKNRFFLMFQNRKEGRLTNSDLTKIVKRKREKIEKRILKNQVEQSQQNIISTSQDEVIKPEEEVRVQNSNHLSEQNPIYENMSSLFENQNNKFWDFNKNSIFFDNSSEEIEKYMSF